MCGGFSTSAAALTAPKMNRQQRAVIVAISVRIMGEPSFGAVSVYRCVGAIKYRPGRSRHRNGTTGNEGRPVLLVLAVSGIELLGSEMFDITNGCGNQEPIL
jgi:hypothetical protein